MKFNVNGTEVEVGGGSGTSVIVCSKVIRGKDESGTYSEHAYIGISEDFDITQEGISLGFAKRGRTTAYVGPGKRKKINGWHIIPQVPIEDGERISIFSPVFMSTTPAFTECGIKYYEVSLSEGLTFYEYIQQEGEDASGYQNVERWDEEIEDDDNGNYFEPQEEWIDVTYKQLLMGTWGICLMKDGKRVSPYAVFKYNGYLYN